MELLLSMNSLLGSWHRQRKGCTGSVAYLVWNVALCLAASARCKVPSEPFGELFEKVSLCLSERQILRPRPQINQGKAVSGTKSYVRELRHADYGSLHFFMACQYYTGRSRANYKYSHKYPSYYQHHKRPTL